MKTSAKNFCLSVSILMLLTSFIFSTNAAEVDESTNALFQQIVEHDTNSVALTFINDDVHPWTYSSNAIRSASLAKNETSEFSFTFSSSHRTEVKFTWQAHNNTASYYRVEFWLDGVYQSYRAGNSATERFFVNPGEHIITFKDTVKTVNSNNYTTLSALRVREIMPLETVVLAEGSRPLTFSNNGKYPWTIENGYIQNGNFDKKETVSEFSTTFTIENPSMFSFEKQITNYSSSTYYHRLWLSGVVSSYSTYWSYNTGWEKTTCVLPAGTYTLSLKDTTWNTGSTNYYTRIRNITLTDNWAEVELAYAGTLGVEVLYLFNTLADVELLKIKGNLNSTDWTTIKQMTNLKGLDLSEASFTSIPNEAFKPLTSLSYIVLPEGVQSIGQYAFQNTLISKIQIPASVTTISDYAFYQISKLAEVTFADSSRLTTIGQYAFSSCTNLVKFIMPNTVTSVGIHAFYSCSNLSTLVLSDALTTLPERMCLDCRKLSYIHLPNRLNKISSHCFASSSTTLYNNSLRSIKFPESLRTIEQYAFEYYSSIDSIILPAKLSSLGSYAFTHCTGTKYIQLPSYISGYSYCFDNCNSLEKIVCPSATPPSISNDPFSSGNAKANITLEVPSFAVAAYKLHTYWYQFGTIVEGEDPDYWKISDDLSLTNNRRMNGEPTVCITTLGRLTVGGAAPFPMNGFEFNCSSSSTSALVNSCPLMTANSVISYYYINEASKWYFITPLYDMDLSGVSHGNNSSFVFRYYDAARRAANGTGNSWQNITNNTLSRGKGYILHSNGTGWLTLRDSRQQGSQIFAYDDVTLPLETHTSESAANENWNFIGNPYPCYFDIWYLDYTAPITVWTGSTYKAYSIADDSYALRPMEAFFVQKPDMVSSIIFHKEGRQVSTEISHSNTDAPQRLTATSQRQLYNLTILGEDDQPADETRIVINPSASTDYEFTCDASKFMSFELDVPQIYSLDINGVRMAINERPLGNGMIPLGCYVAQAGEYVIASSVQENAVLVDSLTGIQHDFAQGGYTFTTEYAGDIQNRFFLRIIAREDVTTAINESETELSVREFTGGFAIDCTTSGATVYSVDGRMVATVSAGQGWTRLFLPAGVYVIRTASQAIKHIVK